MASAGVKRWSRDGKATVKIGEFSRGGGREATPERVITIWGARSRISRVGLWRKRGRHGTSPVVVRRKRVTSSSRQSKPSGTRWLSQSRPRRVSCRSQWTMVQSVGEDAHHFCLAWCRVLRSSLGRCMCGILHLRTANIIPSKEVGVSWSCKGMERNCSMSRRGWDGPSRGPGRGFIRSWNSAAKYTQRGLRSGRWQGRQWKRG